MTHYKILCVSKTATVDEIKAAYCEILQTNHPDKTRDQAPFAQNQAADDPFVDWALDPGASFGEGTSKPPPGSSWRPFSFSESRDEKDDAESTPSEREPQEAEYRTLTTPKVIIMDIKISEWRLFVTISSKFRFTNDVTEISDPEDNHTVVFEVGLERDKSSPEYHERTSNELTVKIQEIPDSMHVAKVQKFFTEINTTSTSLVVTITADEASQESLPWEFGFDFDTNDQYQTIDRVRATCMILSIEEPPEHVLTSRSVDTPELALKWDKKVKADAWCNLGHHRVGRLEYEGIILWRVVAVGYKKASRLQA